MKILAIDTSTYYLSMAVAQDKKILASRHVKLTKVLSSSIMPEIEKILKKTRTPLSSLDGFAVGLGPGSFTSLRVGLSTVKAFSLSTGKKVVGISSLDVMAMNVKEGGHVCVASDAKRNLLYACFYTKKDNQLTRESDYLLISPQQLLNQLSQETILVGDGIKLLGEGIKNIRKDGISESPQAKNLALLALQRFEQNKFDDVRTLVPLYLYPEDCQVQNKK